MAVHVSVQRGGAGRVCLAVTVVLQWPWMSNSGRTGQEKKKGGGQSIKTSPREHGVKTGERRVRDDNRFEWTLSLKREKSILISLGAAARRSPVMTLALIYFPHFVATLFHTALWGQMNVGYFKAPKWQPFSYLYNYYYSTWTPVEQLCPFYYPPQKKNL